MIFFNFVAVGMFAACFGVAFALATLIGTTSEDVLLLIAGPLLFVSDMLYRWKRSSGPAKHVADRAESPNWWFHPRKGGHVFFIPVWIFGLFWMLLATYRLL